MHALILIVPPNSPRKEGATYEPDLPKQGYQISDNKLRWNENDGPTQGETLWKRHIDERVSQLSATEPGTVVVWWQASNVCHQILWPYSWGEENHPGTLRNDSGCKKGFFQQHLSSVCIQEKWFPKRQTPTVPIEETQETPIGEPDPPFTHRLQLFWRAIRENHTLQ